MSGIIGRKLGMTQLFAEDGRVLPVTVVEAGPCPVLDVRTPEEHGYRAVQLGFGEKKEGRTTRAEMGHASKAGLETAPVVLREFRLEEGEEPGEVGQNVTVELFETGTRVKVTGSSKGRGFQGVVKRHGFSGGPASHGSKFHRVPGSIGAGTDPSRVVKGKRMPGQMGGTNRTVRNLEVAKVDPERNLLFLKGAVPGAVNGLVFITKQ